jgi:hypothetical protein
MIVLQQQKINAPDQRGPRQLADLNPDAVLFDQDQNQKQGTAPIIRLQQSVLAEPL